MAGAAGERAHRRPAEQGGGAAGGGSAQPHPPRHLRRVGPRRRAHRARVQGHGRGVRRGGLGERAVCRGGGAWRARICGVARHQQCGAGAAVCRVARRMAGHLAVAGDRCRRSSARPGRGAGQDVQPAYGAGGGAGHRRGGDPRRLRRRADARCAGRAVACERARAQHARVVRHLPRRRPARRDPRDEGQDAGVQDDGIGRGQLRGGQGLGACGREGEAGKREAQPRPEDRGPALDRQVDGYDGRVRPGRRRRQVPQPGVAAGPPAGQHQAAGVGHTAVWVL
mmetsp:Transcript_25666/g.75968  ORF Transcript_25666/g.75968 Transcript_25666/m.75968 type:complete len:282 (+) Transcript_25666:2699-3544(+)